MNRDDNIKLAIAAIVFCVFSLSATFDYSYLAFSVLWGFLVFAEVPDLLTITGMIMIVCAGLIAVREQKTV